MESIAVLVTGAGNGVGEQIVKSLRLAKEKYRIVGTDLSMQNAGLDLVDIVRIVPRADDPQYKTAIAAICKEFDIKAIFPGPEKELRLYADWKNQLEQEGIATFVNSESVLDICLDKFKTMEWLKQNGFHCPESYRVSHVEQILELHAYPYVLKPLAGGGSVNTFVAQNSWELKMFCQYLLTIYDEIVIQQYVGTPDDEYTVGVLSDASGATINSIAVHRSIMNALSNRLTVPNHSGNAKCGSALAISNGITQGAIGRFPLVTEACEGIASALGARFSINIQCRVQDGKVYVFEINPRFSGTSYFRALVGYNEPDILMKTQIRKETVTPHFAYKNGYIARTMTEVFFETQA